MKEKTKPERSQDYVQHAETQYISVITPWDQSCTQIDNDNVLCSSELIELNLIFTIKHHQLDFLCLVKKKIQYLVTNYSSRFSHLPSNSCAQSSHNDKTSLQDIWRKRSMGVCT